MPSRITRTSSIGRPARIVEAPVNLPDAGCCGADVVAADGDRDVRPCERLGVELPWNVVGRVDAELLERLDDDGLRRRGPSGRACERASCRPAAARRNRRSAITLRPLFPMHTKSTFIRPIL